MGRDGELAAYGTPRRPAPGRRRHAHPAQVQAGGPAGGASGVRVAETPDAFAAECAEKLTVKQLERLRGLLASSKGEPRAGCARARDCVTVRADI